MVKYLHDLGVQPPQREASRLLKSVTPGKGTSAYDEYLALAWEYITNSQSFGQDPLSNVYGRTTTDEWDFTVDLFDTVEERGIIPENIRAAGVLDYIRILGDMMGIFKVVDAIILRWAQGHLDIPPGTLTNKLYRYHKQADNRFTPEERAMYYGQVFDAAGDTAMLDGMVINRDFPVLWENLMNETVRYIQKFETSDVADARLSRRAIYQATQDLQYNLTVHAPGFVKALVTELHNNQFKAATDILQDPVIVDQLGRGYRKNMWNVIERVTLEDFGFMPNVSAMHTVAIKSNKIFQWLAEFDEATVTDDAFFNYLEDAESYIIEQAQLAGHDEQGYEEDDYDNDMEESEEDWDF